MRGAFLQSVLLLAATATAAEAQNDCLKDLKMPAVGKWAEYQGTFDQKPYTLRYAVVGEEDRDGTPMKWLEMRMVDDKKGETMVYQMLTPAGPAEMDKVEEVVFKAGDKPAMKMGGAMMKMMRGAISKNSALNNMCEGVTLAGEESVTVPAGTFKAARFHNSKHESDTWMVPDQPFSMVKTSSKKVEIALVKSGGGATSSITEDPQEMGGPKP